MNECVECGKELRLTNELIRCVNCMSKDEPIFITVVGTYEDDTDKMEVLSEKKGDKI